VRQLTAFSWGYWGWGTHTSDFVRAADAIERERGMRPPIFADIRFSRTVRATGFRDNAFEETVGNSRYRWLRKLGNENIRTGEKGVRIADPVAGIEQLLQLVIDAGQQERRVIFFCACQSACHCHRAEVRKLLHKVAGRKPIPLTVIEWPGGEPETVQLAVSEKVLKSVVRGSNRIPLNDLSPGPLRKLMALPWCSRVDLRSGDRSLGIISGPPHVAAGWYLPVIGTESSREIDTVQSLQVEATQLRKSLGYAAHRLSR
jgi:hypothetical protein